MKLLNKIRPKILLRAKACYSYSLFVVFIVVSLSNSYAQGFLRAKRENIVNEGGKSILLRGIGLGGWMLQEGYMLRINGEGRQYQIKAKIKDLIGEEKTNEFYNLWLDNFIRKSDIDSLKAWGFNSVRLPMHYNLYTLPVDQEPIKGENTWLDKGFALTDSLLKWCKADKMYLILDMHAAPGGQGNDLNISDRDPTKPSLWESPENQKKLIELWKKISERYRNESWIGGYDIINEPNWGFSNKHDINGLGEKNNKPLAELLIRITKAIRENDKRHLIIIEGNGWGVNYHGIRPVWDNNLVLSFHKYWDYNNKATIKGFLDLRRKYHIPIWLGESGENSNEWFTEAIRLAEKYNIGWSWWALKKIGINNPLEIRAPDSYDKLLNYWNNKGIKPPDDEACRILVQLANNTRAENCIFHRDVVDAMFRQIHSDRSLKFKDHSAASPVFAVDYDLGRNGIAHFSTKRGDYHKSAGGEWVKWNKGGLYRNDGFDIEYCIDSISNGYSVKLDSGEWLQYSIKAARSGTYNLKLRLKPDIGVLAISFELYAKADRSRLRLRRIFHINSWETSELTGLRLKKGINQIIVQAKNRLHFNYFRLERNELKQSNN